MRVCVRASLGVFEAELIVLHESKQQVALTFSKQQACSYFDIDSHCAFTVKCGCTGGSKQNQKYPLNPLRTQHCTTCFVKRHTVERWGGKIQSHRATSSGPRSLLQSG